MFSRLLAVFFIAVAVSALPFFGCSNQACRPGYSLFTGNCMCYKLSSTSMSFNQSLAYCAADNSTLPKVLNEAHNDFLVSLISNSSANPWIGLICSKQHDVNNCRWVNGTSVSVSGYGNFLNEKSVQANTGVFMISRNQTLLGQWASANFTDASGAAFCEQKPLTSGQLHQFILNTRHNATKFRQTYVAGTGRRI